MTVRPIIFSAPMVLALLAGSKTQTRRLATSPLGKAVPGDLLYVRERWWVVEREVMDQQFAIFHDEWERRDNMNVPALAAPMRPVCGERWGPRVSIHLPRRLSRITLEVSDVLVEPLQMISEDDAWAEGIDDESDYYGAAERAVAAGAPRPVGVLAYANLWNHLHGAGSWEANPEVVALAFTVHEFNVDELLKQREQVAA